MIHYEAHGEHGSWLVFVHGMCCDHSDWNRQIERFAPDHRCLAPDLPGHGRSADIEPDGIDAMADSVIELLVHHSVERSVVVGHSLGSRVAVSMAERSDRVVGAVLVDGARTASATSRGDDSGRMVEAAGGVAAFVEKAFGSMFTESAAAELRTRIVDRALAVDPATTVALLEALTRWDRERMDDALGGLDVPVAVVQSTHVSTDGRRSLEDGETTPFMHLVESLAPTVLLDSVPHIGHFTQIEAAPRVDAAIEHLLDLLR